MVLHYGIATMLMFFNFDRRASVTAMFVELGLPSFNTILHNARVCFSVSIPGRYGRPGFEAIFHSRFPGMRLPKFPGIREWISTINMTYS